MMEEGLSFVEAVKLLLEHLMSRYERLRRAYLPSTGEKGTATA
jgi:hypothetical protein